MKILLVDDHGLFLEGLSNLLRAGGYVVVGSAYDGNEAVQLARMLNPDLILMDVRMPNCNGLEATRIIHEEMPEIKVVMLTTSADETDLLEALRNGASGYLLKNLKPNVLFNYLAGLARGEAPLSRELSARLLNAYTKQLTIIDEQKRTLDRQTGSLESKADQPPCPPDNELTTRQREIMEMVAQGLTYKEVGAALHVSENTVKYHMGEIMQRLRVKNREQVVAYALRNYGMNTQTRTNS